MRKFFGFLTAVLVCCALVAPAAMAADQIELSLSLTTPPTHLRYVHAMAPWTKMIEEKTNGKVKITPYFANALAAPNQLYQSCVAGVADITEGAVYFTPGQFPLTEMAMLPEMGAPSALASSKMLWYIYKNVPAVNKEWAASKVLFFHSAPANQIITTKKPIHKIEDLKGLKIRVSGAVAVKMGKALGFSPVDLPMADLFDALQKGVIDGVFLNDEPLVSRRMNEVVKYTTDNLDGGHDAFFVVMNLKKYNSLPDDVKKAIDSVSGEFGVDLFGKAWDKFNEDAIVKNNEKGVERINIAPEELERFRAALAPVKVEYAKELEAKKLPGKQVLDALMSQAKK